MRPLNIQITSRDSQMTPEKEHILKKQAMRLTSGILSFSLLLEFLIGSIKAKRLKSIAE